MVRRAGAVVIATLLLVGVTGCGKDGDDVGAFCAAVAAAPSLGSVIRGFTEQDPVDLQQSLDQAESAFATLRDTAPSAISADVKKLTAVVDDVITAVRDNPDDRQAAAAAIQHSVEGYTGIDKASANVSSYAKKHCDVDLNAGLDVATTTTVAPAGTGDTETGN